MLPPLEDYPPRFGNWSPYDHEQHFIHGYSSDSADGSLGSTPSPSLNIRDLLVDSPDDDLSMEFRPPADNPWLPDYSVDAVDGDRIGGGSRHPESTFESHDSGRTENTRNIRRHCRLQEREPYPRPPHSAPKSPAPHPDQLDFDAENCTERNTGPVNPRSLAARDLNGYRGVLALRPPSPSSAPTALPPSAFYHSPKDLGDHIRNELGLPRDAPVNLWAVADPADGTRPKVSLPLLTQLAIYGSETKRLTLQGIYQALVARFRFFKEHETEKQWRNSIRHALSLYQVFVKVKRPLHDAGKGDYWTLDHSRGEGTKRFKRARKRKAGGSGLPTSASGLVVLMLPGNSARLDVPPSAMEHRQLRHHSAKDNIFLDPRPTLTLRDPPSTTSTTHATGHNSVPRPETPASCSYIDPALRDDPPAMLSPGPPTNPRARSTSIPRSETPAPSEQKPLAASKAAPNAGAGIRVSSRLRSRSDMSSIPELPIALPDAGAPSSTNGCRFRA